MSDTIRGIREAVEHLNNLCRKAHENGFECRVEVEQYEHRVNAAEECIVSPPAVLVTVYEVKGRRLGSEGIPRLLKRTATDQLPLA